ncbi:enoyl-CoA hydratase/isomerase family protein [Mycobacterium marseillense]|uniref:enoyl-CoA hydratase/isomerase family protein n=1 Tax=Mycobacterium marseillense TaxID=701042 RepID=UPI0012FDC91E|nr:enoyl-CoA hydratase/isomerase family protein [Mycobacterium marseillense]
MTDTSIRTGVVKYEERGHIAVVTLSRPEQRNAFDRELSAATLAAWDRIKADPNIRVAVVTGAGPAFSAGADLKKLIPHIRAASDEDNRRRAWEGPGWAGVSGGYTTNTPIIAAINGDCIAGGHELAEFCDIRITVPHARFGHQEIKWGLMPGDGGCSRLPRIIGLGRAMELILTGRIYDAEEALRIGFVTKIVEPHQLMREALAIAETIASNGPLAVRAAKQTILRGVGRPLNDNIPFETETFSYLCKSEDWTRGQRAFFAGEKPDFQGR